MMSRIRCIATTQKNEPSKLALMVFLGVLIVIGGVVGAVENIVALVILCVCFGGIYMVASGIVAIKLDRDMNNAELNQEMTVGYMESLDGKYIVLEYETTCPENEISCIKRP